MQQLTFTTETFEGPLDLLLHLISKHKLNIADIEIGVLLSQYLSYMDEMKMRNLDVSSSFIEMAARLVHIKTVSLLPSKEEAEDLKRELSGELIEYHLCQLAAANLKAEYKGHNRFTREPLQMEIDMTYTRQHPKQNLYDMIALIQTKIKFKAPPTKEEFSVLVERRVVSVSGKITSLISYLKKRGKEAFKKLFSNCSDKPELVATFLAVLELVKNGRATVDENQQISYIKKENADGN